MSRLDNYLRHGHEKSRMNHHKRNNSENKEQPHCIRKYHIILFANLDLAFELKKNYFKL